MRNASARYWTCFAQRPIEEAAGIVAGVKALREIKVSTQMMQPVVFLPGLLCDQGLWRQQVRDLADIAAPMIADLTLDDSIEAMARRTLAVAPARFALAGLSMGGYVALEIMRQAPERVTRLALVDTSARGDTPARQAQRQAGLDSLRRGKFVGVTRKLLADLVHPSRLDDHVGSEMREMAVRVGGEAFVRQQQAILSRRDAMDVLRHIDVPTVIAVGDVDRVTPPAHAEEMHHEIGHSTMHVLSDCGHMPALERPQETSVLLRTWLETPVTPGHA